MSSVKLQDTKSIHKKRCVSYTSNKLSERELKAAVPFKQHLKKMKYLGVNVTNPKIVPKLMALCRNIALMIMILNLNVSI